MKKIVVEVIPEVHVYGMSDVHAGILRLLGIAQTLQKKDIDKVRHDEIKTRSIIDVLLWDKAKWKGFGFLLHPQEGLGIILAVSGNCLANVL